MDKLLELDRELFLALNDLHLPWLDQPMFILTNTWIWLPLYAYLLYLAYKKYNSLIWIFVLGVTVAIALSDQICSNVMKPIFERLRPSRDPSLEGMVHVVNGYRGGLYGFASSHAANTFSVAMYVTLLFYHERKGILFLFLWSAFVSYTRIYLGVHYPGDVFAGALVGVLCAAVAWSATIWALRKYAPQLNENQSG